MIDAERAPATSTRWSPVGIILGLVGRPRRWRCAWPNGGDVLPPAPAMTRSRDVGAAAECCRAPVFWLLFAMMTDDVNRRVDDHPQFAPSRAISASRTSSCSPRGIAVALTVDRITNGLTRPFFLAGCPDQIGARTRWPSPS